MSPKRKMTTAPDEAQCTVKRTTDNHHEVGLRPELKSEFNGEPWPQVLDFKVEYLSIRDPEHHEVNMVFYFRGKKIVRAFSLILVLILLYATVTHDHVIVQRVIDMLQHLK